MPLYEYACKNCGQRFEILQRMGEGAEGLECPGCGEHELEKQFSTFSSGSGSEGARAAFSGAGCGPGGFT
jgi:putative FmdB family regulatory protein